MSPMRPKTLRNQVNSVI